MPTTNSTEPSAIHVAASLGTPSSCLDIPGALDIDVTVTVGDVTIDGEITLAPRQYDGRLAAYGATADHWVSGAMLAQLARMAGDDLRGWLDAIESAAIDAQM